jgi:hypothetical protein
VFRREIRKGGKGAEGFGKGIKGMKDEGTKELIRC